MGSRGLIKLAVGLVALGGLGVLFVRSAQSTRAEPYSIPGGRLTHWTLAADETPSSSRTLVSLRPPPELMPSLFNQVFARSGETMSSPMPAALPLVLQSDIDPPGAIDSDTILSLARDAGFEAATIRPRCMAHRRVSEPGSTRQVYFLRLEVPGFEEFRRQLAQKLTAVGAKPLIPAALTPVMIVGATDASFSRWLPLTPDADDDCIAPVAVP
ncbi:MAG TPA: hypothetical protein VGH34_05625 [Vicinamibacterales bacterium]